MPQTKFDHKEFQRRLKEDELGSFMSETIDNLRTLYSEHGRLAGIILALIAVIVLAGYLWTEKRKGDFNDSQMILGNATALIQQSDYTTAETELTKLITNYSGTAVATLAHILRGDCLFHQKKYEQALQEYQTALPNLYAKDKIPVRIALAQTYRSAGNPDQALRELDSLVSDVSNSALKEQVLFLKGGCYEDKNDVAKALETYKAISKESNWRALAQERIEWLEAQAVAPINS